MVFRLRLGSLSNELPPTGFAKQTYHYSYTLLSRTHML